MPIIRRTRACTAAYGVLHWLMAVVVWSWDASCVHCESYCSTESLVLLMMGIIMPETC